MKIKVVKITQELVESEPKAYPKHQRESILLEMLIMSESIQLQNVNTKSKWHSVVPSCLYDNDEV